jgi:hypothetical protein
MIQFVLPGGHEWTLQEYLSHRGRNVADRFRILPYESLPSRRAFDRGTYVLVGFARLSPGMLHFVEELHRRLSQTEGIRLLNHPIRTLRRFELLEELWRRNRNEFRAVRAAGNLTGLRYPVFLRSERSHDGALSPLLRSPREVEGAIGHALLLDRKLDDLLVVEFCDTADASGTYRKYSAFIVGDRVLARNLELARGWMVKDSRREFSRAALLEERDYIFGNPHEEELLQIFQIAQVQYGRIDYAVKDGRIQTWEINLHATIGPAPHPAVDKVPEELRPIREESRDHFYRGFEAAWRSVDTDSEGRLPVSIVLDPQLLPAAKLRTYPQRRLLSAVRGILRPLKPLLEPLARPVLPLVGRLARQGWLRPAARS